MIFNLLPAIGLIGLAALILVGIALEMRTGR